VDRRALFFLTAAMVASILAFLVHDDLVYVPRAVAITYLVLAVASWLDWRSANGA